MQMAPSDSLWSSPSSTAPDANTDPGPPITVLSFPVSFYLTVSSHSPLGSTSDRPCTHVQMKQCTTSSWFPSLVSALWLLPPLPWVLPSISLLSVLQEERWRRQNSRPGALYHLPFPWISAALSGISCLEPTSCCRFLLEGQGWRGEGVGQTVLMTPLSNCLLQALVQEMSGSEASNVPVKVSATLVSGSDSQVLDIQQSTNGIGQVSISFPIPPTVTGLRLLVVLP